MNVQPVIIGLTVVLVVGIVVVQVFSTQIARSQVKLEAEEVAEHLKKVKSAAESFCNNLCSEVLGDDCQDRKMAQFCLSYIKGDFDLNGNGLVDYNQELLGGVGICEDRVYCSQLIDCGCRRQLTMENCVGILCEYWADQGMQQPVLDDKLNTLIQPGACWDTSQSMHWYSVLGPLLSC
jgi:hypothetical protein